MASSLTSALSSMEVMLDALMQRGIGKPDEPKPKEEEPPALPNRPTGRGRLPSLQRPGAAAPWMPPPPMPPSPLPPTKEDDEERCLVNQELERRATEAEEQVKQKEEEMRQKEELIATLQHQVEHCESRLSECEVRMRSVEEELQRQITSLQMAQAAGGRRDGSKTSTSTWTWTSTSASQSQHGQESSRGSGSHAPSRPSSSRHQPRGVEPTTVIIVAVDGRTPAEEVDRPVAEAAAGPADPSSAKSVDELKTLKRQFASWKKEYEARLKKTKAELKRLVHAEKKSSAASGDAAARHGQRRCGWWRIKAPKCCRAPKCCSFKLPSPKSCCCCFRRCC